VGSQCKAVNAAGTSQHTSTANNIWPSDDLDFYAKCAGNTDLEISTSEKPPQPVDGVQRLERKSSGTEASWLPGVSSIAVHDDHSSSQIGADQNRSLHAGIGPAMARSETTDELHGIDWNTSADEFNMLPVEREDRCIRCNKLRPTEQCPVCHCMYSSVASHIGVHSIRKMHTPSALLEALLATNEDGATTTPVLNTSRSSDQSLMCTDCGEILPSAKTLRSHVKSKTCLKFAICTVCGTTCENESKLQSHMKTHIDADKDDSVSDRKKREDFSCAACDTEFDSAELLSQHMEEHVDLDWQICRICGKTFMHMHSLRSHMRCHTGRMPFQCETCGKACRTRRDLKEHREVHSSNKPHVCATCGKQFRLRKTYMRHRVTHSEQKNYECDYCGMRFWFNYRRTRHMLVHTGEKPYVCSACGDRFTQWNGLAQHRLRSCRK